MKNKLAFPGQTFERGYNRDTLIYHGGMTIRQYYAAMAMQGLISKGYFDFQGEQTISNTAFKIADAMLEAEKEQQAK